MAKSRKANKKKAKKDETLYALQEGGNDYNDVTIYKGKPKTETIVRVVRGDELTTLCHEAGKILGLKAGVLTKLNFTLEEIEAARPTTAIE